MDTDLDCDFYFGDNVFVDIKSFDPSLLRGFKGYMKACKSVFKGMIWHKNTKPIFSDKYTHYIISGIPADFINWRIIFHAKLKGKKVYLWTHGFLSPQRSLKGKLLGPLFFKFSDGIFLYGKRSVPFMISSGCKAERIHIIHNSLDTNKQTEIYNNLTPSNIYQEHFGNSYPVALYIGRLQKRKKIDQLLKAVALCKERGNIFNVVIIGGIEDENMLPELADQLSISNQVWFYGKSYTEEINGELIYNAHVCVCPSEVGLTSIHSLSYGTPVISNDGFDHQMPEVEAVIDNVTGAIFKEDDINDLSEKIERWCSVTHQQREDVRISARNLILSEWSVAYQIDIIKKALK